MNLIAYIGLYAPLILLILSVFLLRNKKTYLIYFVSGFLLNNILNILLKLSIKEPRPTSDYKAIEIGVANGVRFSFDKFGMPSGHAQTCAFCLVYITLALNSPLITSIYSLLTLISVSQRYIFNNHSILQLVVGLFIGTIVGYILYALSTNKLRGNIKMKPDDYGPI